MRVLNTTRLATRILTYTAADLPYPPSAMDPAISSETMQYHYQLYQRYAQNFTAATDAVAAATTPAALRDAQASQAFNGSGFILHSVYFTNMTSDPTQPGTATTAALNAAFGSVDTFLQKLSAAANALEGPGWVILGYSTGTDDVHLLTASKHQDQTIWGTIPILAFDLWEHAYYLDYQIDRPSYISAWTKLLNWNDIERRLQAAQQGEIPI